MRLILLCCLLNITAACMAQSSTRTAENIATFARLYGYVKYFHPADEAAGINWNQFAIYGAHAVQDAPTDAALIAVLNTLFNPIAPGVKIGNNLKFNPADITPPNSIGYKPVYWLHTGVGLSQNDIYSSVRLNRPRPVVAQPQQRFAPFTQTLDATTLRNKEIKLVGHMKADVADDGSGHFWLRVDKTKGMGFFYNMDDKPATKNEWANYEFSGKVDKEAKHIVFGGFLSGSGTIWVDKIALFERDNPGMAWKPVAIQNGDFKTLDENKNPTGWYAGPLKGYKYAVNPLNNINTLTISSEVTAEPASDASMVTDVDYKYAPAAGTVVHEKISNNIEVIVPLTLHGTATQTYPKAQADSLDLLKSTMAHYAGAQRTAENLALRLGDVVIAWNIFKHFFPYWQDATQQPDQILTTAIHNCFTNKSPQDFKQTLLKMTEPLNDGHIWVTLRGDTSNAYTLPLQTAWVQDKVVIDAVLDSSLTNIKRGDVIEKINDRDAVAVYKDRMQYISGSPQWKSFNAVSRLLSGPRQSAVTLLLRRDGKIVKAHLNRELNLYESVGLMNKLRRQSGEVAPGIYYLDLSFISKDSITSWADRLAVAKGIICDLRGYPTGNHNLINYLLTKKENTKWMFIPKTAYPNQQQQEFVGEGWNMEPLTPHFGGKVIFITDGRAISYAESFMGFIKDFQLATIIGQPTAGTNGNINPFTLPGGYTISWTGMLVKNHDGGKHHITGIVPDLPLQRTIQGIAAGKDEFYEKALELAGN